MKRIVSALLCLAMLFAFATVASAEEPATGFTAPKILGVQKGVAYDSDGDEIDDSINLRFVSGLTSLKGERIGYEIKAQFVYQGKGQSVVYQGDDMETDTVYTSILADGETVTAKSQGCVALFVLVMEVPVTLDIVFTATAYIKANGEKVAVSETKQFVFSNGEFTERKVIMAEDFNDMSIDCKGTSTADTETVKAAIEAATGWTANACGTSNPEYPAGMVSENGVLKIYGGSGVNNYTVLPKGTLSKYNAYSIEMDLNVEAANGKMAYFALHSQYNSTADGRSNEIRLRNYTDAGRTTLGGTNDYLGMQYSFVAKGTTTKNVGSDFGLSGSGFGQNFHMRVEVDTNAMTIAVFVTPEDGVEEQIFSDKMSVVPDGGFLIGIQQAVITIDNLIIRSK